MVRAPVFGPLVLLPFAAGEGVSWPEEQAASAATASPATAMAAARRHGRWDLSRDIAFLFSSLIARRSLSGRRQSMGRAYGEEDALGPDDATAYMDVTMMYGSVKCG